MLLNDLAVRELKKDKKQELKKDKTSEKKVKDASEGLGKSGKCPKLMFPCFSLSNLTTLITTLISFMLNVLGCDPACGVGEICKKGKCEATLKGERCKTRRSSGSTCVCKYGYTRRNGECKKSKLSVI